MEISRAMEILDPRHREHYTSLDPVNQACRMGRRALALQLPRSVHPDFDPTITACPNCGSEAFLRNSDFSRNRFCGNCGQAITFEKEGVAP